MPDGFRHVRKGEPIDFNAQTWNAVLDAARAEQKRRHDLGSFTAPEFLRQGSIIKIKNQSGADLDQFDILGLDQPMFKPMQVDPNPTAFMRPLAFRGTMPVKAQHMGKFAIVLDPLGIGSIGRAYVDGVCQVKINVLDASHTCADVQDHNTEFLVTYKEGGSAQILWKQFPTKTGVQWAVVRLGTNCRICCNGSSSSSSSTSSSCPTLECKSGCGQIPASCLMEVQINGLNNGALTCEALDCDFFCHHLSGCTWYASFGLQNGTGAILPTQCTLQFGGGVFTVFAIDAAGDTVTFSSGGFDCQSAFDFGLQSTSCTVSGGATCRVFPA